MKVQALTANSNDDPAFGGVQKFISHHQQSGMLLISTTLTV
jgi:hypothetical protein